jgi:hypothetical protein
MAAAFFWLYRGAMTQQNFHTISTAGLVVCAALLATLTGCMVDGSSQGRGYRSRAVVQVNAPMITDDYDYYPGYETYYSRNRHEYVYRDGNAWVRRPEPRGVTVSALLALPSVRLDFHDSPELHHSSVARSYPKNWRPPAKRSESRDNHNEGEKSDRRSDDRRN